MVGARCPGGRSGNEPLPRGEVLGMSLPCLGLEQGLFYATDELCTEMGEGHMLTLWCLAGDLALPLVSLYRQYQVL